jgi:N-methylhydantoinase B
LTDVVERHPIEVLTRRGPQAVKRHMQELMDYTERMTRAALRKLPDGEWSFEDWIDDDGIDYGKPIRLLVTLRKSGDTLVADWTGSSPQVKGAINNTLSYTKAASYTGIKSVLPPEIPNNDGFHRAVPVIAPAGTIANCVLPAATAARGLTGFRMVDCFYGALALMLPDRVFAAPDGGNTGISIGGYYADRRPFIYVDFICSAWGGRPWADGLDGNASMFANLSSHPAEIIETEHPLEILGLEFMPDTGGAGKFRGGMGFRRDYRFVEEEAVLQVRSDRRAFRPFGLYGGSPGKPCVNIINPQTERRTCRPR